MILTIFNLFRSEWTKIRLHSINLYFEVKQWTAAACRLSFYRVTAGDGGASPAVWC